MIQYDIHDVLAESARAKNTSTSNRNLRSVRMYEVSRKGRMKILTDSIRRQN